MIESIAVIVATAGLFLAIILTLAAKPAISGKIIGSMLVISAVGGFCIYGYGYSVVESNPFLALIRATLAVCGIFVGKNDLAAISSVPVMQQTWMRIVFWVIHLFALYTSASAAVTTIGAEALKKIRLALSRRGSLVLIYSMEREAVRYGEDCCRQKNCSVVFVSPAADAGSVAAVNKMGAALRTDARALHPDAQFLKSMGIRRGKRKIRVICMGSEAANYQFAAELKDALEAADVNSEQTSLVIFGNENTLAGKFQAYKQEYGFGSVAVFQRHDQAARLLVRKCPPWEEISFDENGAAQENYEALIIGFGLYGQSVLKQLIRCGQFYGSKFHATVIDPQCHNGAGYLRFHNPGIFNNYSIQMIEADGRSEETFRFLESRKNTLKYIVISVGDEKNGREISESVARYLFSLEKDIPIVQCTSSGIIVRRRKWESAKSYPLVSPDTMDFSAVDHIAMGINHRYTADPKNTLWEDWRSCDYFSRMSCRAFADFLPAFLRMLGITEEKAMEMDKLQLTSAQTENAGQTEHLRWCAFHDTMGFTPMSREEWDARANQYLRETESGGRSGIRIGKNMEQRRHACLIPWEGLDELSEREKAVTGKDPHYKRLDINNVTEIPALLRME